MSCQSLQKELRRKMEEEERRIPVFTVLKNGAILKNIFVVNHPSTVDNVEKIDRACEEILNVGRHQDCHILLTHPSISRFHLRIFSNPSSQKLSVMDLSSVHGTWVNDTKIEPRIKVELNEGDTLRVGGSSRVHKLHWVPLNQAYDIECSFFSALDGSLVDEKEEETAENREGESAQDDQVEHGEYGEQKDIREEIDGDVLPIDDDKEETANVEGETVEAIWDDFPKIDYGEFGEHKYPLEEKIDQEILAIVEGEVMETAKGGEIVTADQDDPMKVEHGDYEEYKDILEEIDRDILATDEDKEETTKNEGETVESYWDDLLKIDYGEFGEYKYPLEDIDQEILAIGEGSVMETAKVGEIVTADQDDPMKVEHGDYEEYIDILEEIDWEILAADEDKEETAKIEGETLEAYWDDLLKIDYGEFGEYEYPSEEIDQEILAIGEGEVMENAKVGGIVTADQIDNGGFGGFKDQAELINEHIPGSGEDAIQVSQVGDLLQIANEDEVNEEINQGMLESTEEVVPVDMAFEGLGSPILNESCVLLVKEETPMRMPVPQKMDSLSSDEDVKHISAEINNLKRGYDCIACSEFAFLECMSFSLPLEILSEAVDLKSDKEEKLEVGIATESALDIRDNNIRRTQNEDSESYLADGNIGEFDSRCSSFLSTEVLEETKWQKLDAENPVPLPYIAPESEMLSEISKLRDSATKRTADIIESADASLGGQENYSASKVHEDVERQNTKVEEHNEERSNLSIHLEDPEPEMIADIDNLRDSTMKLTADIIESADASLGEQGNHSASKVHEDGDRQNMEVEEHAEERSILSIHLEDPSEKSANPCLLWQDILSDVTAQQLNEENQTLLFSFSRGNMPFKESNTPSLWSRRGKPATVLQLQSGKKSRKSRSTGFNAENRNQIKENAENKFVVRDLSAELDREIEEIFTPEKENLTPDTRKVKFMKEIGKFGGVESSGLSTKENAFNSSDGEHQTPVEENLVPALLSESILNQAEQVRGSNICLEEDVLHSSAKENQTPKVATENKRVKFASRSRSRLVKEISEVKGRTKLPFQSLQVEFESKSELSVSVSVKRGSNTTKYNREAGQKVSAIVPKVATGKKNWIMVADTSSFLEKESRRSLQLLQGLRGTQLVIPQIVIRELDSLNQKFSLFRRKTEAASALEWMEEEAMAVEGSKWWIHIQSSAEEEEERLISATEAEADHVLDYALFSKRTNANAQIVLLINDVSLKIKAMAEGLLCETPQEFRSSLVNPFSDRFMWAPSSPRGRTWSCLDDVVLQERYYRFQSQRNAAKGLKLILLHDNAKWY